MGKGGKAFTDSWTKNPLENIATGGMVSLYKGGAAGLGVDAPTSSSIGLPELLPGAEKVKGFEMPKNLQEAEMQMIQRQSMIAAGQAPSIANMQYNQNLEAANRAGMAMAASQRGGSNPMLAFRNAQQAGQQAQLEGSQTGAIMAEEERRKAEQVIAAQAAAQRGVALQQAMTNQQAQTAQRSQNMQLIAGLGGSAMKAASGGAG